MTEVTKTPVFEACISMADPLANKGFAVQTDRDNADYVYRVQDLADLAGRVYAKKRNQVKKYTIFPEGWL